MKSGSIKLVLFLWGFCLLSLPVYAQTAAVPTARQDASDVILTRAAVCEEIINYTPFNPGVVFSISNGKISCFTAFDGIPEKMFVYHKWFRQDSLVTRKRLTLKPPQWSTFSSIQLREADKGPWRVEIVDANGTLFKTIRFSITD